MNQNRAGAGVGNCTDAILWHRSFTNQSSRRSDLSTRFMKDTIFKKVYSIIRDLI